MNAGLLRRGPFAIPMINPLNDWLSRGVVSIGLSPFFPPVRSDGVKLKGPLQLPYHWVPIDENCQVISAKCCSQCDWLFDRFGSAGAQDPSSAIAVFNSVSLGSVNTRWTPFGSSVLQRGSRKKTHESNLTSHSVWASFLFRTRDFQTLNPQMPEVLGVKFSLREIGRVFFFY